MNQIVNKFLMVRDKFIPKLYLKQPGFTYSACGPFTRRIERELKLKLKELKSSSRQEIQILFTEMSLIKLAFNIICLMVNQKI